MGGKEYLRTNIWSAAYSIMQSSAPSPILQHRPIHRCGCSPGYPISPRCISLLLDKALLILLFDNPLFVLFLPQPRLLFLLVALPPPRETLGEDHREGKAHLGSHLTMSSQLRIRRKDPIPSLKQWSRTLQLA